MMWFLVLVVFIIFMFLFYASVEKDKSDNEKRIKEDYNVSSRKYLKLTASNARTVIKQIHDIFESNKEKTSHIVYKDMKIKTGSNSVGTCYEGEHIGLSIFPENSDKWIVISHGVNLHGQTYFKCELISRNYRERELSLGCFHDLRTDQQVFNFLQDFVAGYSLEQSLDFKINKELERYRSKVNKTKGYISLDCTSVYYKGWLSLDNDRYYMEDDHSIYDMHNNWKGYCRYFDKEKEAFYNIIKDIISIETCEDPYKTHWKYFLELKMKAKKQREVDCHKYVDDILQKQIAYNDLQINYQMLPSAPITDVESFRNFCKVVHDDAKYEDYEIQNYLLLKKSMQ